ncbi:MAG: hypothetical protein MI747_22705, partial [Desulfobacterales bacterium]|nr:hypothetical protein [Desulfobacterales bacterium]
MKQWGVSFFRGILFLLAGAICLATGSGGFASPTLVTDVSLTPQNTGDISSTAWLSSHYYSLRINDSNTYSPEVTFTNTGNINLLNLHTVQSVDIHIISNNNAGVKMVNHGNVDVSYHDATGLFRTYAIHTQGSLENSGRISMDIYRPTGTMFTWIHGIRAEGSSLVNTGDLEVSARGGLSLADARATGIEFTGTSLNNSGTLTISARGGSSNFSGFSDARAKGIYTQGNLINTKDITVTATGGIETTPNITGDAYAYGIETDGNLTLDSRGLIQVSALPAPGYTGGVQEAHQVEVTSGTTT